MDQHLNFVLQKRVEKTLKSLEKNNVTSHFVPDEAAALAKLQELMPKGSIVGVGSSMTLFEIGAIDMLRNGSYHFLDRYQQGLTAEQAREISLKNFSANFFLASSNAITEDGELYNIDGKGTRVAPMLYGPEKVIIIAGINKIVSNVEEAIQRGKEWAAPANTKRLNRKTPCTETGYCAECNSPERICNEYVLIKRQTEKGRIHVILVNKALGY